ncbi:helix-turn-helix domain-containing protein [Plantactinospora sp. WMMB334]|uniref:helix-turn-helix transcriptional regulator n=1 Tax=Plantactinospora sp. WMMB334 TaxID=3404119 RepID=UPI003B9302CB
MVRFGQLPHDPGEVRSRPDWAGIRTSTLRDHVLDPVHRGPSLVDRHLLILVTVGHGAQEVDFSTYPCRPGSLLWVQPGQVVRHGGQGGLDAIMVSWSPETMDELGLTPPTPPYTAGYWQLAGEDEDAVISEVSQLVVDCQRHHSGTLAADLLRHQLAVLLLRLALLPRDPPGPGPAPQPAHPGSRPAHPAPQPAHPGSRPDHPPAQAGHSGPQPEHPGPHRGDGSGSGAAPTGPAPSRPAPSGGTLPAPSPDGVDPTGTFWRLRHEVERSYGQTRRVEDYADRLACSVRTLTRACLAATGRSAKQVIDDRVALEARRLLAATDLSVADVGRRLGFPEPTNFGRFFHREVGHSPGAFRAGLTDQPRPSGADRADRAAPAPTTPPGT